MTLTVFDPRAGQPVTITVPAYRPTRLGSNILLALGTMTLAQVMAPAAAQAQCNSSSNPAPPSPVVANFLHLPELRQPTTIGAVQRDISGPRRLQRDEWWFR